MKVFSKVFCFTMGILGIASGMIMATIPIIQSTTVLVVLAVGAAFFMLGITLAYRGNKFPHVIKWLRRILEAGIAVIAALYLVVTCLMIFAVHHYEDPYQNQTVVVLGCKANNGVPSLLLKERLDSAMAFLKAHPQSFCIACGGKGQDEIEPESTSIKRYLENQGISADRIFEDNASKNTLENLQNAKNILISKNLPLNIVIATNNFHEYRSQLYASSIGLTSEAISANARIDLLVTSWIREVPGIVLFILFKLH